MITAVRIYARSLVDFWENLMSLAGGNVVAFVMSLPLLVIAYTAMAPLVAQEGDIQVVFALLLVLPNPLATGLYAMAAKVAGEETVSFRLFWKGLREFLLRGLALWAIALVTLFMLTLSVRFYWQQEATAVRFLSVIFAYGLVVWAGVQLFAIPLLVQQTDKRFRLIYRNAIFVLVRYPLFTVGFAIVTGLVVAAGGVITILSPVLLISLLALAETRALKTVMEWETKSAPARSG